MTRLWRAATLTWMSSLCVASHTTCMDGVIIEITLTDDEEEKLDEEAAARKKKEEEDKKAEVASHKYKYKYNQTQIQP